MSSSAGIGTETKYQEENSSDTPSKRKLLAPDLTEWFRTQRSLRGLVPSLDTFSGRDTGLPLIL